MTWKISRGRAVKGKPAGATVKLKHTHYKQIQVDRNFVYLHRLAFLYMTGVMPPHDVDHRDGNGLNNKWGNLRTCTRAENCQNHKIKSNNLSGYTGVGWHPETRKWRARIKIHGREIALGMFDDPAVAGQAYLDAKTRIHLFNPVPR